MVSLNPQIGPVYFSPKLCFGNGVVWSKCPRGSRDSHSYGYRAKQSEDEDKESQSLGGAGTTHYTEKDKWAELDGAVPARVSVDLGVLRKWG
jgi:hypothetical protein